MNIRIVFYLAILISFFSCDTRKIKINREDNFELVEYIDPDKWISTSRLGFKLKNLRLQYISRFVIFGRNGGLIN